MTTFRILVTGSRKTADSDEQTVRDTLDRVCGPLLNRGDRVVIVQGECPYGGVDLAAQRWAETTPGAESEGHPAPWKESGKAAGMIRNSAMVALGADICLAFPGPGSRGTWDCIRKAADAGIMVRIYPVGRPDGPS